MYPLVYGRTRVLRQEVVGIKDAVEKWAGKGEIITKQEREERDSFGIHPDLWSHKYQWLPSNLAFREDGTVKFTSYINNIDPIKHFEIYRTIEKLIDASIPAWEQCLIPVEPTKERNFDYFEKIDEPGRTKGRFGYFDDPE